jgi:hypothetical protein
VKGNETQRNATGSDAPTPQQEQAIEGLLSGQGITRAAREAGVDRTTVWRWLKDDPAFQAAYNRARLELQAAVQARLLGLTEHAVTCLEQAIKLGDARTALALLRGVGLLDGEPARVGPDDPERVRRQLSSREMDEFLGDAVGTGAPAISPRRRGR